MRTGIDHLKKLIIPTKRNLFGEYVKINQRVGLPQRWVNDIKYLCNLYNADVVFPIVGPNCHYFQFNKIRSTIGIRHDGLITTKEMIIGTSHEIAHAIQYKERNSSDMYFEDVAAEIRFEQEACRLSYFVYLQYFKHVRFLYSSAFRRYDSKHAKLSIVRNFNGW